MSFPLCLSVCSGEHTSMSAECASLVYFGVFLCRVVFIEVIHAEVIEGNHFIAKLYCNYGDEGLLFRDTNAE